MIVEFAGLSGSGKSTVVRALSSEPDVSVVSIPSRIRLIAYGVMFAIGRPRAALCLIRSIMKEPRALWRLLFLNAFLVPAAKYERARRIRAPFVLIDQGFAQTHLSLREAPSGLPFADAVVIGTVDEDTQRTRLDSRGYSPRAQEGDAAAFLALQRERLPRLSSVLDDAGVPRYDLSVFARTSGAWRRVLVSHT